MEKYIAEEDITVPPLPIRPETRCLPITDIKENKTIVLFENCLDRTDFTGKNGIHYILYSAEILVMPNESFAVFSKLTKNDIGVFGDPLGVRGLEKHVYFLLYDTSKRQIVEIHRDTSRQWRTVLFSDIIKLEVLSDYRPLSLPSLTTIGSPVG